MSSRTVAQLLRDTPLPRQEAQLLLLHVLQRPLHERAWLIAHDDLALAPAALAAFQSLSQRRAAGEPLAYLTGRKHFYGLELQVNAHVLDPRPDTETLVDWALRLLPPAQAAHVLDLGTGSGAVALAVAQQRPLVQVCATDASAEALAVARGNGQKLGLPVRWLQADSALPGNARWWSALAGKRFDLALSNPPYLAEDDPHLSALQYEPHSALVAGADGLDDVRAILAGAPQHLKPGGWLLFEHGWQQASAVRALFHAAGWTQVQSHCDLAGIERCSGACWP